MSTPDHKVAEQIGRAIDGKIFRLQEERRSLLPAAAATRVAEIDAELSGLALEKARIDPRRPPASLVANVKPPVDVPAPVRVK